MSVKGVSLTKFICAYVELLESTFVICVKQAEKIR